MFQTFFSTNIEVYIFFKCVNLVL